MHGRLACGAAVALGALLALTGCGAGGGAPAAADGSGASSSASAPSASTQAAGALDDVCALLPTARLRAAIDADPGRGVAAAGKIGGGQCTWRVSDTRTAVLQVTRQPDVHLPASVWKRPRSAADVAGVDRGWAAAETHTILIVKDGRGALFTDVGFRRADQAAYDALAEAIAQRL